MGYRILSAVDFRKDPSRIAPKCLEASASFLQLVNKYPDQSDRGPQQLYAPVGLYRFVTPLRFAACKAITLGDARDGSLTDPKKIARKLDVNGGHASAPQLGRELVNSEGIICTDSPALTRNWRGVRPVKPSGRRHMQVDLLFLDDIIALHVMDVFSRYTLFIPVRAKNPVKVWGAFCNLWIGVFGPPFCIQMEE